jgi:hypothetical protein
MIESWPLRGRSLQVTGLLTRAAGVDGTAIGEPSFPPGLVVSALVDD